MIADEPGSGTADPLAKYTLSPAEGKLLVAASRAGVPYLVHRDANGAFDVFPLRATTGVVIIGRAEQADLRISGDQQVSRVHAELRPASGEWMISNLSRNQTFLNTKRVDRPERLADGDRIRVGRTMLAFAWPDADAGEETSVAQDQPSTEDLSASQRRILIALCRPLLTKGGLHAPATNKVICAEVNFGEDHVKKELGRMFVRFGFGQLEQNQKRGALAAFVIETGLVTVRDL